MGIGLGGEGWVGVGKDRYAMGWSGAWGGMEWRIGVEVVSGVRRLKWGGRSEVGVGMCQRKSEAMGFQLVNNEYSFKLY